MWGGGALTPWCPIAACAYTALIVDMVLYAVVCSGTTSSGIYNYIVHVG